MQAYRQLSGVHQRTLDIGIRFSSQGDEFGIAHSRGIRRSEVGIDVQLGDVDLDSAKSVYGWLIIVLLRSSER